MNEQETVVVMDKATFTYQNGGRPALDGVSLQVHTGDFLGIIGPSGAGKSTLIYSINGIIPHYYRGDFYGSVRLGGLDTFETSLTDLSHIGATVLQDIDAQMVASVVEDELLFGLENFGVPQGEIPFRVEEALDMVGIADLRHREIATLSGGQKQKVALAAMFALKPRVLLLDEPTGELDPQSSRQVFSLLKKLNREQGITVIVVEQKIGLLAEFADRVAVMDGGTLRYCGDTREVLNHSMELLALGVNVPRVTSLSAALYEGDLIEDRICCINVAEAKDMVERIVYR